MRVTQWKRGHWSAQFDAKDQARACEIAFGAALAQFSELDDSEHDDIIEHISDQGFVPFDGDEERAHAARDHFEDLVLEYQQRGRQMLNDLLSELQRDAWYAADCPPPAK